MSHVGHFEPFTNPFTGQLLTHIRCGMCRALLPLPGDYPLQVEREDPNAIIIDLTGPNVAQHDVRIVKPICWHHTN